MNPHPLVKEAPG